MIRPYVDRSVLVEIWKESVNRSVNKVAIDNLSPCLIYFFKDLPEYSYLESHLPNDFDSSAREPSVLPVLSEIAGADGSDTFCPLVDDVSPDPAGVPVNSTPAAEMHISRSSIITALSLTSFLLVVDSMLAAAGLGRELWIMSCATRLEADGDIRSFGQRGLVRKTSAAVTGFWYGTR